MDKTDFKARAKELVSKMTVAEKMSQLKNNAPAIPRLNIPEYNWLNECLHGVARSGMATCFPQAIGMAASFNTGLMKEVAEAISDEARAKYNEYKKNGRTLANQGLTFWSPNINIFRDPRWGRGHETYGEDPYLTGEMGAAFIKGLQGEQTEKQPYRKLDATVKHYAVHSGPENRRHNFNSVVNKKDLTETYIYAFKYCIDNAGVSAVMGAYNLINGEPACGSRTYLKELLFGELGFDGYTVSDCAALCNFHMFQNLTENEAESAALALNNGLTLNCGRSYNSLMVAYDQGLVSEETITEACERLFTARFRLGMFDDDCVYDRIAYDVVESAAHRELNKKMASESIVLLKNDGILPLDRTAKITVVGPNADAYDVLVANYHGSPSEYTTILRGIQNYADGRVYYDKGCDITDSAATKADQLIEQAMAIAKLSDVIVMVMGLNATLEGEQGDAYNSEAGCDKTHLELPQSQQDLYNELVKLCKTIVFVNVSGSAINMYSQKEQCAAIIQCFYPGAEGGNALAEILFGIESPSGRLPVTFYKSDWGLPDFTDYNMEGRTYKFFKWPQLYAFGHGLSYTKFIYSNLKLKSSEIKEGEDVSLSVTVSNIGDFGGREAVQVYLRDREASVRVPVHKLVAFDKVFIGKGQSKTLELTVKSEHLYIVDDEGEYVCEPGEFDVFVGGGQPGFAACVKTSFVLS